MRSFDRPCPNRRRIRRASQRRPIQEPRSELDARHRRENLRGAFVADANRNPPRHVALFDDVMTTGATLVEATSALKKAGVLRVDVWVLARVPAPP